MYSVHGNVPIIQVLFWLTCDIQHCVKCKHSCNLERLDQEEQPSEDCSVLVYSEMQQWTNGSTTCTIICNTMHCYVWCIHSCKYTRHLHASPPVSCMLRLPWHSNWVLPPQLVPQGAKCYHKENCVDLQPQQECRVWGYSHLVSWIQLVVSPTGLITASTFSFS